MNIKEIVPIEVIGQRIHWIRGKKVMLDFDLADLYQVATKNLNRAVSRNIERFPEDFMFQLSKDEVKNLRFQFGTSSWGGYRYYPYAFTEHGVAMLSSVLKSKRAAEMNILIIRIFIKLRELLATNEEIALKVELISKNQYRNDDEIREIWSIIKKLTTEPTKPKYPLGFTTNNAEK